MTEAIQRAKHPNHDHTILDATAKEFPLALVGCYFDIKAAGRL